MPEAGTCCGAQIDATTYPSVSTKIGTFGPKRDVQRVREYLLLSYPHFVATNSEGLGADAQNDIR